MGKIIDRFACLAFTAIVLYALFLGAFQNIPAACALAFACCALLIRRQSGRSPRFRMSTSEAQQLLSQWAFGPDDEAHEKLACLLENPENFIYMPKHPSSSLSVSDVFSAWKANRDKQKIVIACPCYADGRARAFARTLGNPSVEIADAARLIPLIRKSSLQPPQVHRIKHALSRLRAALLELPYRRSWKKSLLFGILIMPVYLLTANPAYLFLSIGALFLAGVSLRLRSH